MQQEFEIENYRFKPNDLILVSIIRGTVAIPITIPKEHFELFLMTEGKLNSTVDDYFLQNDKVVHPDLYKFIVSHPIVYRGMVYEKPLVSINYGFQSHKAAQN